MAKRTRFDALLSSKEFLNTSTSSPLPTPPPSEAPLTTRAEAQAEGEEMEAREATSQVSKRETPTRSRARKSKKSAPTSDFEFSAESHLTTSLSMRFDKELYKKWKRRFMEWSFDDEKKAAGHTNFSNMTRYVFEAFERHVELHGDEEFSDEQRFKAFLMERFELK